MFEAIRSDAFCKFYNDWKPSKKNSEFSKDRILPIIQRNLEAINKTSSITQLKFTGDGKIEVRAVAEGSRDVNSCDLTKFTRFVKQYLETQDLSEVEAREMRKSLQKSLGKVNSFEYSNSKYYYKSLAQVLAAQDYTFLKEDMRSDDLALPGKDVVINKYNELRKKALTTKKKISRAKFWNRFTKVGLVSSAMVILPSSLLAFAFFPL